MDITKLSPAISQMNLLSQVNDKVMAKAMDSQEALGQGVVNMIEASAMERSINPAVGGNFDMRI